MNTQVKVVLVCLTVSVLGILACGGLFHLLVFISNLVEGK